MTADLPTILEAAAAGSVGLDRQVFAVLGGEERSEAVSNQGGGTRRMSYWPGEKHPAMGLCFTRSLNDIVGEIERRRPGLSWLAHRDFDQCTASVGDGAATAATPALALAAALVRHVQEAAS